MHWRFPLSIVIVDSNTTKLSTVIDHNFSGETWLDKHVPVVPWKVESPDRADKAVHSQVIFTKHLIPRKLVENYKFDNITTDEHNITLNPRIGMMISWMV